MSLQDNNSEAPARQCSAHLCTDGSSDTWTPVEKDVDTSAQCNRSCPIDRLSAELLLEIFFQLYTPEHPDELRIFVPDDVHRLPWVLGRVCSKWRFLSRADRRLWGSIIFIISGSRKRKPDGIARFLEVLPLSVLVEFRCYYSSDVKRRLAPHLNRCQRLEIHGEIDLYEDLFKNLPQKAFVNICEVTFRLDDQMWVGVESIPVLEAWASTAGQWAMANNLHTVTLGYDTLNPKRPTSTVFLSIPLPWHQIKTFHTALHSNTHPNVLWAYLRKCSGIVQLNLRVLPGYSVEASPISIDLPDLREVSLWGPSSTILLPELSWRNLTSLVLSSTWCDDAGEILPESREVQRILQLCMHLEELSIEALAVDNGETFPVAGTRLQFPFLRSLSVSTIDGDWELNARLIYAPALQKLHLTGSPADLLDAAKTFHTSLSHVEFYNRNVDKTTSELLRDILAALSPTTRFIDHMVDNYDF
ncbi:hypothetical protein H0H92_011608 [Tricholoma furcatifolium]|nr:hypothetical protein H0H92_011608 [Tricholoma furcatifolium]